MKYFCHQRKLFLCVCMYKRLILTKEHENNGIEVIVDGIDMLSSNGKHIGQKLGHNNLPAIANKYDPVCKKRRYELVDKPKKQPKEGFYVMIWH